MKLHYIPLRTSQLFTSKLRREEEIMSGLKPTKPLLPPLTHRSRALRYFVQDTTNLCLNLSLASS